MHEIIKVENKVIGVQETNAVNAREVHEHLGVKTHLSTWIKRAIEKYDFLENIDFSILKSGNPNGGIEVVDYIVTLDMAKELCMLENNQKGKETRKYFISIEKQHTQLMNAPVLIEMFKQHNELMQQQTQVMLQLQEQVTLLNAPIVKPLTLDAKMMDKLNLTLSDVALILARDRKITLSQAKMVLYSQLNTRFEVSNYYKIPHFRYLEAMQFLRITKEQLKLKQENIQKSLDENIERVLEEREYEEDEREYEEDERPATRSSGMYH